MPYLSMQQPIALKLALLHWWLLIQVETQMLVYPYQQFCIPEHKNNANSKSRKSTPTRNSQLSTLSILILMENRVNNRQTSCAHQRFACKQLQRLGQYLALYVGAPHQPSDTAYSRA
jgi:hypothetical protein